MHPRTRWLVTALLLVTTAYALAEELTLVTYYPSPRGVYNELKTMGQTTLAEQGGSVGIGTTNPNALMATILGGTSSGLHVRGPVRGDIWVESAGSDNVGIFFANSANANRWGWATNADDLGIWHTTDGQHPYAGTGAATHALVIQNDGNVGIGTTSPKSPAPNGQPGNLDANDVWIRAANGGAGRWASQAVENLSARVASTADMGFSPSTQVYVSSFNHEHWDLGDFHNSANPSRLTAPMAGTYLVTWYIPWLEPGGASGQFLAGVVTNGGAGQGSVFELANADGYTVHMEGVAMVYLAANDYVELSVWNGTSNGNVTVGAGALFGMALIAKD